MHTSDENLPPLPPLVKRPVHWGDPVVLCNYSGLELAYAKAATHRLECGVWTSVRFRDIRQALSACERLIILEADCVELRDYCVLLYHCGFYKESLQYLNLYQNTQVQYTESIFTFSKVV